MQEHRHPLAHVVVCGGIGGAVADTTMHSLDTVKTKMQAQLTLNKIKYSGMLSSLRIIMHEEGIRGFFSGILAASAGSLVSTLFYFATYESTKRAMIDGGINPTVSYLTAAAVGDVIASCFYVPSEVVKTRLQLQGRLDNPNSISHRSYHGSLDAFKRIYKKRGVQGLYFGWGATLVRDVPFTAVQFAIYENLKKFILRRYCEDDENRLTTVHDMISGGVAGVVAGGITTPLDVIKTYLMTQKTPTLRMKFQSIDQRRYHTLAQKKFITAAAESLTMTQGNNGASATVPAPLRTLAGGPATAAHGAYYGSVTEAFRGIYARNGLSGLFAGLGPRMVWTGCQSIVMFVCYEKLLSIVTVASR